MGKDRENMEDKEERPIRDITASYGQTLRREIWRYNGGRQLHVC